MRTCIKCKKPMYTSNESIWIKGKNYPIHKKCKQEPESHSEQQLREMMERKFPQLKEGVKHG